MTDLSFASVGRSSNRISKNFLYAVIQNVNSGMSKCPYWDMIRWVLEISWEVKTQEGAREENRKEHEAGQAASGFKWG